LVQRLDGRANAGWDLLHVHVGGYVRPRVAQVGLDMLDAAKMLHVRGARATQG
jgi:hypothetical protein